MRQLLVEIGVVLLLAAACWMAWDRWQHPQAQVGGPAVVAVEAPIVKGRPKTSVALKKGIEVYKGATIKKDAKLPDAIQKDEKEQVVASSQVRADLHPQTITTVVDTETGKTQTFTKIDAYPWLAWEPRGSLGLAYGLKYQSFDHGSHQVGRLQGTYDLVRIKAFTVGATATLDTDRDAFVGVAATYRW